MKERCKTHNPDANKGYHSDTEKHLRGCEQRQCPTCLRWFFHGEFGRGWSKGLKPENAIKNIISHGKD